jgi:ribosomal protein S27AE
MQKKDLDLWQIEVTKRPLCERCGRVLTAGSANWYCIKCDGNGGGMKIDRRNFWAEDLEANIQ